MDQRRSTHPTRRNERRLHMTFFTLFLDLSVNNAFALFEAIDPENAAKTTSREFKREICVKLAAKHIALKKRKAIDDLECPPNRVLGTSDSAHMQLENINKQDVHCFFACFEDKN